MTKIKVFIDFESISAPFSYDLNIDNDFPFAYSIGIYKNKKFITKTTIINFNKIDSSKIYEFIRKNISKKIREILQNKNFQVNSESISFIGWVPNLEKKILFKSFKGVEVIDQSKGKCLSLSKLTEPEFKEIIYFKELKKEVNKNLDPIFIQKRGLNLDGALAALAGYQLFIYAFNKDAKWKINIDIQTLIKEIYEYSKDDVKRMFVLYKNPFVFTKRSEKLVKYNMEKQIIHRKINKLNTFLKLLNECSKLDTIEFTINNVGEKINDFKKEIENLK